MAISVLDVRDTVTWPRLALPSRRPVAAGTARRLPGSALAAGLLSIVEAVGLLAVALQGLDGLLTAPARPAGPVLALFLLGLAAWIVVSAGSGAAVIDGSGRRLLVGVAVGELGLVTGLGVLATVVPVTLPVVLPLPGLLLLAAAVPVGKLLLAGSPSAAAWLAAGPRAVERAPDPATTHRALAALTLGVIGVALTAVALLAPAEQPPGTGQTASTVVYQP